MRILSPISPDGSGDDWPQIQAALQATDESVILLKPGIYNTRHDRLTHDAFHGRRIVAEGRPRILYRSAHATLGQAQDVRAGLYVTNSHGFDIEGIDWEGDVEPNLSLNIGPAVYLRGCTKATLRDLGLLGGASLFQQDPLPEDRGLLVTRCQSFRQRVPCIPGPYSRIENSSWELPPDSAFDRIGDLGSSHAIYLYAGRDHVTIEGCEFRNIRVQGIKASGSALPIASLRATGNRFVDCGGGVLFGADKATDPDHTDGLIEGNTFLDCANRGAGWFTGAAITILGSMGVVVRGNKLLYSRPSVTPAACKGIEAQRYYTGSVGGRLCEDVLIADNEIIARSPGTGPGSILTHGIYLYEVARARVERNRLHSSAAVGVTINPGCSFARVRDLVANNIVSAVQAFSAQGVEVRGTRVVRGPNTSSNPQIRFTTCVGVESLENIEAPNAGERPRPLQELG